MKTSILLVILAFAGCATVSDIRSRPADRVMDSVVMPKKLANCVKYKAPAEVSNAAVPHYHFSLTEEPQGVFHVLAEIPGQPMGEADFQPNGKGGSRIELRSRWNFWGKDAFWDCIQSCASPQNNPGAVEGVK